MRRAARGAFVETAGYIFSLALRFGSNLALTRLLAPDAFGLIAMVSFVQYGLFMLADIGLQQAVVSSAKGEEDDFLNTVWSLQVIRGVVLTLATLAVTYPAALWFKEPRLLWILPIAASTAFIHGFASSRVFVCAKRVQVAALLKLELTTQIAAIIVNVAGAYYGYGVLALLVGQIVSTVLYTILSHFLPGTHRDRWYQDAELRKEIIGFGRWIFFSSALTIVARGGDSAVLGRLLGTTSMGLYNLANTLSELPASLGNKLLNSVVYPTLSTTYHGAPQDFSKIYYRLRLYFDAVAHTVLGGLAAMAGWIVHFLYPDGYSGAGEMLAVLAFRASASLLGAPWESAYNARGQSHFVFRRSLLIAVSVLVAMPVGFHLFGSSGLLWGTVVAQAAAVLVFWPAAHEDRLLKLHREVLPIAFLAVGFALGTLLEAGLDALVPDISITAILKALR